MLLVNIIIFCTFVNVSATLQKTKRENFLLSRKRRYLVFPKGANFVMTMTLVKAVMIEYPQNINVLAECDLPFKLPYDTRFTRKKHRTHHMHQRDVYSQFEDAFEELGFNGNACVKRMLCDAQRNVFGSKNSLVRDIINAVFTFKDSDVYSDHNYKNVCNKKVYDDCEVSFLNFILGNFRK